jgi:hypothetical protein
MIRFPGLKRTLVLLSFSSCLFSTVTHAFQQDSTVEIRLKLLQQTDGVKIKNIALSISIINHTDKDIYIPGFDAGPYRSGIHVYEKKDGQYSEIDLLGQRNWHGGDARFIPLEKEISRNYEKSHASERKNQDSILNLFCANQQLPIGNWIKSGHRPMFLKANRELTDFIVYDLNFLFKQKAEYKICFEPRQVELTYSPDEILGYRRFNQDHIESNTLIYETLDFSLKKEFDSLIACSNKPFFMKNLYLLPPFLNHQPMK